MQRTHTGLWLLLLMLLSISSSTVEVLTRMLANCPCNALEGLVSVSPVPPETAP